MTAFESLIASLQAHEGYRPFVYDDGTGKRLEPGDTLTGNPTIGYGWALNKLPMSLEQATAHLRETVQEIVFALDHRLPWLRGLDDVRRNVFYELAYNLGINGLLGFPKMLAAAEAHDWPTAKAELLDSDWAREDVSPERSTALSTRLALGAT